MRSFLPNNIEKLKKNIEWRINPVQKVVDYFISLSDSRVSDICAEGPEIFQLSPDENERIFAEKCIHNIILCAIIPADVCEMYAFFSKRLSIAEICKETTRYSI